VLETHDFDASEAEKGITFKAFKSFQRILIRKLKLEICWTILRYYGYDNDLRIVEGLWDDGSIPDEELEEARAFELKKDCLVFLATIFKTHTTSRSRMIDVAAVDRVFATTERGSCPWDILKETVYESRAGNFVAESAEQVGIDRNFEASGGISQENWVGLWIKYFHKDPKVAFRDLVYIGFCGQLKDAIQPIMARPRDIFGVPSKRKTFNCLVVGASGSGKSTFLDAFIVAKGPSEEQKEPMQPGTSPTLKNEQGLKSARSVVKAIKERHPKNKDEYNVKFLSLTEVSEDLIMSGALFDESTGNAFLLTKVDAIIYIFESNDAEQVDFVKVASEKFKEVA